MSTKNVYIASSRMEEIGSKCVSFASENLPKGYSLCDNMQESDIFVSVLYDTIIDEDFISSRERCVNFHPGILPEYKGSATYSWAIINKEPEAGVTLHEIDSGIDSGPIIEIKKTLISNKDTAETVFYRCMDILYNMFCDNLSRILSGEYKTVQNKGGSVYLKKHLPSAKDITHIVRAFTFGEKEKAFFYNSLGEKIYLSYYPEGL